MARVHKRDASCGSFNNGHGQPDEERLLSDARVKIHNNNLNTESTTTQSIFVCFNQNNRITGTAISLKSLTLPGFINFRFLVLHLVCILKNLKCPTYGKNCAGRKMKKEIYFVFEFEGTVKMKCSLISSVQWHKPLH